MPIHPTAIVHPDARIAETATVGAYAIVEADVSVGRDSIIGSHASLKSGLRMGERVKVFEGAVLAGTPQDLKFDGSPSFLEIGDDCVIREFATLHRSVHAGGTTRVGRECFIMGYGHVAHDCDIADRVIIASYAAIAGHVEMGRRAFVSGNVSIHQFTRIGELAMVGGGSKVNLDVPPFVMADGFPARAVSLNKVGLARAGVSASDVAALKRAFRVLFRSKLPLQEALEQIDAIPSSYTEKLAAFVRSSRRGICRGRRRS